MLPYARMPVSRAVRGLALVLLAAVFAVCFTYPLAFKLDQVGRLNTGDGQWSLWCVTWVAHALSEDPGNLYDANIFVPHRNTLAYSEANIVPGLLGVPAYLLTKSPYATHNSVVILGFAFSFLTAYALAHYLTRHVAASIACGIAFAYCPFIFARTAHIQLLMTFGIPWALHMMHRLIDRPTLWRSAALGLVLVIQALACAYYGIFAGLTVGLGLLLHAWTRRLWTQRSYWIAVAAAAFVAVAVVAPFFVPYIYVQQDLGFARTIEDANMFSADAGAWLASSAHAHRWMHAPLQRWGGWSEVLFPGFITTGLGLVGAWIGWRTTRESRDAVQAPIAPGSGDAIAHAAGAKGPLASEPRIGRTREATLFYGLFALIALWSSFGPSAGLYTLLHHTIPVFSFLRAPARMGIMVTLALGVMMAIGVSALLRRYGTRQGTQRVVRVASVALPVLLAIELLDAPLRVSDVPPVSGAYRMLATMPRGPVAEFPFYWERPDFPRHARYMLFSTYHWQPLINGYSDHIPVDFREIVRPLSGFPSRDGFRRLRERRARYAIFHLDYYDRRSRERLLERIEAYRDYLTPLYRDEDIWMFAITGWP